MWQSWLRFYFDYVTLCYRLVGLPGRQCASVGMDSLAVYLHSSTPWLLPQGHQGALQLAGQQGNFYNCLQNIAAEGGREWVCLKSLNAAGVVLQFGVSDAEGSLCLWQSGTSLSVNRPFLVCTVFFFDVLVQ